MYGNVFLRTFYFLKAFSFEKIYLFLNKFEFPFFENIYINFFLKKISGFPFKNKKINRFFIFENFLFKRRKALKKRFFFIWKLFWKKGKALKRIFVLKTFKKKKEKHFFREWWEKVLKKYFLRIVCRGNVYPRIFILWQL